MPTPADLQRDLTRLTGLAADDLAQIWRQVATAAEARRDPQRPPSRADPPVRRGRSAARCRSGATTCASITSAPRPLLGLPADLPDQGTGAMIGWADRTSTSLDAMQALIAGGMARRIADWARETVMGSSFADPLAEGWMRVSRPGACGFCP